MTFFLTIMFYVSGNSTFSVWKFSAIFSSLNFAIRQTNAFCRPGRKILEKNNHLLQAFILLGSEQEISNMYREKRCVSMNQDERNTFW